MKIFIKVSEYVKNPHILLLISLTILTNVLVLSNILQSDYFGDDKYNFQVPGIILAGESVSSYVFQNVIGWFHAGRFFPISAGYMFYLFNWFDTLLSYKLMILTLIVVSNLLFSYFTYLFSKKNIHIALLVMGLTPVFFQYRLYHDPILSFHALMPILFSFLVISSIFLLKYIQKNKKIYLILSLLSYAVCLGMYEISYTFIFIYFFIIISQLSIRTNTRYCLITFLPYFCTLTIVIMIAFYLKFYLCGEVCVSTVNNPYHPNWDLLAILKTYFLQTVSVLPTTYYFNFGRLPELSYFGNNFIILAILLSYIFIYSFNHKEDEVQDFKYMLILAMLLLFLPGSLISLSTKFQGFLGDMNKVQFGKPYLPVYIQTFGLTLLLSIFISKVSKTKNVIFILFGLGVIWTIHTVSNNQVISSVNKPYKDKREVLTSFFSGDFKEQLKDGDYIKFDSDSLFHNRNFVSMITDKDIKVTRNENDNYMYQISIAYFYDLSMNKAFFDITDKRLSKSFIVIYKKIGNIWSQVYNEYKSVNNNIIEIPPIFNNFYPWEGLAGEFRWAKENPSIVWINPTNKVQNEKLFFEVKSLNARDLNISLNDRNVVELALEEGKRYQVNESINLQPGRNYLKFVSEELPVDPPGDDNRALLFSIEKMHPFYTVDR